MLSHTPSCPICVETGQVSTIRLLKCAGCNVMFYCGKDHQASHRPHHKIACNAVKKAQRTQAQEADKLRDCETSLGDRSNFFEEHAGHFWGILETRDYMRACWALSAALESVGTYTAVSARHDLIREMLRLSRSDNMGVRNVFPFVCLRLGKNQEAYDFCEWYRTIEARGPYDWGDLELPYLDIKDADVFRGTEDRRDGKYHFAHEVAMTLLKIRFLWCLNDLKNSQVFSTRFPAEIFHAIQIEIIGNYGLASRMDLLKEIDYKKRILHMEQEISLHWRFVREDNSHFWPLLFEPGEHLKSQPQIMPQGTIDEADIILQYSYNAWKETPGAIDFIKRVGKADAYYNMCHDTAP